MRGKNRADTLCWDCRRACGGCPWSASGTQNGITRKPRPVKGWKATRADVRMQSTVNGVHNNARSVVSYIVEACPLFVPDRRRHMGKSSRENWADVRGYEGLYQVSDKGNIRRVLQNRTRILKQYVNKANGYCYINLCKNNKSSTMRVHKIVARAFLGEPPKNKLQINHIDGNKANNAVDNLEYCDQSENMRHAYMTGLEKPKGLRAICLDDMKIYDTLTDAARAVSGGTAQGEMVARVCRGERSHYRGFRFAFYDDFVNGTIPPYKGKSKRKESKSLWR